MASSTKFRPLGDRILVERSAATEEHSAGGIIIPDTAKEKPQAGKVVAIGNGKRLDNGQTQNIDVKVGDQVLFGKYSGSEIKIDGGDLLILREDEILGVLS